MVELFRYRDCPFNLSVHLFCPVMRWLPAQTVKTARMRKRRRWVVYTAMFKGSYIFTVPITDQLSGRRKRRSLIHLLLQWRKRRRSQTLTAKTCQRWTYDTSLSKYILYEVLCPNTILAPFVFRGLSYKILWRIHTKCLRTYK